jgi:formate-dependent nitrite reductase membrane component NrfD
MAERVPISEERLNALRDEAAKTGSIKGGVTPITSTIAAAAATPGYYGNPVLKPPTWTWEVPLYLFLGGMAGASTVIALVAFVLGNVAVTRVALWAAFAGAILSPPLLISDLGRPARFLYMMRVFKVQSAMSVGVWTLVSFSGATTVALLCRELLLRGYGNGVIAAAELVALLFAALFGLLLASYTSVLLSLTAIPVWSENRHRLPVVFLAGALGSASSILELLGFMIPATQLLGIVASSVETLMAIAVEVRKRRVDRPLREGNSGRLLHIAAVLSGLLPLILRIGWQHSAGARSVAAVSFLAGALITRYGWVSAGRASSRDPQALFELQRSRSGSPPDGARISRP